VIDHPCGQLEQYVDRVVGPLHAGARRKSIIREELVAHLLEAYQAELRRAGGDARAAFDATIRRFGDCDELATELEASVPPLERLLFLLFYREHLMWRLLVLIGLLGTLFGMGVILPALAKLKHLGALTGQGRPLMEVAVGVMIGAVIVTSGMHLLAWGIARRVRNTA
jgi:hypothetical protein